VGEALARLDKSVARLEAAAKQAGPVAPFEKKNAELNDQLASLARNHGMLKSAAERAAGRLDTAIGRLTAALKDDGA
jgi:hypothetical protein